MTPPSSDVSPELRAFFGVWVGEARWPVSGVGEATMCVGFVVESIGSNGTVSTKYIWGDKISYPRGSNFAITPGVNPWNGKMIGSVLHLETPDNQYSFELRVTSANELRGVFSTPTGKGPAQLMRR
jgi:hypothetical protein